MFRKTPLFLALLLASLGAQEFGDLKFDFSLQMRIRGISLSNGSDVRMLDPQVRLALQAADEDRVDASQNFMDMRVRPKMRITALDLIRVETQLEIGDVTFGVGDGGDLGTDGKIIEVKHLFLDFDLPKLTEAIAPGSTLSFRAGLFGTFTPQGLVFSDDGAGVRLQWALPELNTTFQVQWLKAIETSRLDLDGDGRIDNDYNDRDLLFFNASTAFSGVKLDSYFIADLDNTLDTPEPANQERNMFWVGLDGSTRLGPVSIDLSGVYNWGRTSNAAADGRAVKTNAWAGVLRLSYDFGLVKLTGLAAGATGNDPDRQHRNDAFVAISPEFTPSNILYDFSGFNLTNSNLSGTACFGLEARAGVLEDLSVTGRVLYALLTSAPDSSGNVFAQGTDRDLGWELNLNLEYQLYQPLKIFCNSGVLLPGDGLQAVFDSPEDGEIWEVIFGLSLSI